MPAARYVQARQYASILRSSSLDSRSGVTTVPPSAAVRSTFAISSVMTSPPSPPPRSTRSRFAMPPWPSRCTSLSLEQAPRVTRDHELLVRRHHPCAHTTARRADARSAPGVGPRVELEPEPSRVLAHALADRRRVLTDPACENDRVQSAEGGSER